MSIPKFPTTFSRFKGFCCVIGSTLLLAVFILQVLIEHLYIPTGSMRPTFREQDHLLASKTAFGINIPLLPGHLYFDQDLLLRGKTLIFSSDSLDLPNGDTHYFGFIPYKKQLIKRLIGKPGDLLYFYGGKIYGMDKEGRPLNELMDMSEMAELEFIPFGSFEGRAVTHKDPNNLVHVTLRHMYQDIGKLTVDSSGNSTSFVYSEGRWQPEKQLLPYEENQDLPRSFSDYWGIRSFAMARLLNKEELEQLANTQGSASEDADLYLELRHTPSLNYPEPRFRRDTKGQILPVLNPFTTALPLQERHLERLRSHLYTSRFVVSQGQARTYSQEYQASSYYDIPLEGIEDGIYEFEDGKAYTINWWGKRQLLADTHPLYPKTAADLQLFFNLGIEFSQYFQPSSPSQAHYPSRYAYFRNGVLYVMGVPLMEATDPTLQAFIAKEHSHSSSSNQSYVPFLDPGPPLLEDGSLDTSLLERFGVRVPEGKVFVLGDNHAASGDSRFFGFVPLANIQGSPQVLLWPQEGRSVALNPDLHWFNLPFALAWGSFIACMIWSWARGSKEPRTLKVKN